MPNYERRVWWLVNQITGSLPELYSKQRLVESRRQARQNLTVPEDDPRLRVPAAKLEAELEAERSRIARIEDKARGTVVGITIAVSVAGAGIGMFSRNGIFDGGGVVTYVAAAVLALGLGYFLESGWQALSAYAASPLHTPNLEDRPEARATSPSGDAAAAPDDDVTWRKALLDCLELNRFLATAKANRFSASITLLRNGLFSIFLFAVLAIAGAITHDPRIRPLADQTRATPGLQDCHPPPTRRIRACEGLGPLRFSALQQQFADGGRGGVVSRIHERALEGPRARARSGYSFPEEL